MDRRGTTRPRTGRIRAVLVCAATVLAAALTAGCSPTTIGVPNVTTVSPTPSASSPPTTDGTGEGFYSQTPQWVTCTGDEITSSGTSAPKDLSSYDCATVVAPLDWDDPAGETITLRVAVHHASNSRGMLFYNLGGPGGASVQSLAYMVTDNFGTDLVDNYDLVALDPRGVGASEQVVCMSDEERDSYAADDADSSDTDLTADQIVAQARDTMSKIGQGCLDNSGDLAAHVDTVSAAKDFDMVRAVLGQDMLNYLGYSYGTFLGATYAGLFPDKVGRFVLDGALDPAMTINEVSDLQMRAFEESIAHWVEDCQSGSSCPFTGTTDQGVSQLSSFLDRLASSPLTTQDSSRPLTQSLALTAVIGMLYSTQTYTVLTQAMQQAIGQGDGSTLLYLADYVNDRNDDGTYSSNALDAQLAINALDYGPVGTVEEWEADAKQLQADLPVLGQFAGYSSAGLGAWPIDQHASRTAISASGAAPIVVIGTTHDPATPYVMAQNLASELDSGVLVTWDGWNHTAYSKSGSACIATAVEDYFVDGTVPADGLECSD